MTQCCSAIVRRPLFSQNFRKFFKETNISLTSSRAHRKLRVKTIQLNSIYQFAYNFKTVNAIKKIIADLKSVSWITYNSKIKMSGLRGTLSIKHHSIVKSKQELSIDVSTNAETLHLTNQLKLHTLYLNNRRV